jgi:hypothetical protein
VEFSDYVFKWSTSGSFTATIEAAEMAIVCAFTLKHHQTREAHRVFRRQPLGGANGTGDKIIRVEEISGTLRATYDDLGTITGWEHNTPELEAEADLQLAAAAAGFGVGAPQDRTYPGFKVINPDGAIQQLTYSFRVGQPCTTRASRNNEWNVRIPSYAERQRLRRLIQQREAASVREIQRRERTRGARHV